jgi:oligopeptide/dipeptide ABC transporter ATP-binding protein
VVARICDRVAVMYGGQIVESGSPDKVLSAPSHPYTRALLDAVPRGLARRAHAVLPIETNETLGGCRFRPRCDRAEAVCAQLVPSPRVVGPGHLAACHLVEEAAVDVADSVADVVSP